MGKLDHIFVDPLPVRLARHNIFLYFFVVYNSSLFKIQNEHSSGLKFSLNGNVIGIYAVSSRFGSKYDEVIFSNHVSRRPETVSIQSCADNRSVGKDHCGRSVPGFHHSCMVLIKSSFVRIHKIVLRPCFRNHHHHCMRNASAAHYKQFKHRIESRRIALSFHNNREHSLQIFTVIRRFHNGLPCSHPVLVSAQRIYLAVVGNHPEGMSKIPRRKGICRESHMDHRHCRDHIGIVQIFVIFSYLGSQQHSFIN